MAVTSAKVAAVAGVSTSTVSRVFLSPEQVTASTRERVLAVSRQLGYSPNRAARSLAMGRTGAIGLIVPDIANPFFAQVVKAVQARVRRKDHSVLVADSDEKPSDERDIALAMAKQVDGLILVSPRSPAADLQEINQAAPVVLANRAVDGLPAVVVPSSDGMRQAVEHLAALGHEKCCYLNVSRRSWSNEQREAAVKEVCTTKGIELIELGPFEARFEGGVAAADTVRASGATAVIAHNDMMAIGVISRLQRQQVNVPDDISVIGVDNTVFAGLYNPALTTVRIPLDDMGAAAVDLLLDVLAGDAEANRLVELDAGLVVRESTGPTRRRRGVSPDSSASR